MYDEDDPCDCPCGCPECAPDPKGYETDPYDITAPLDLEETRRLARAMAGLDTLSLAERERFASALTGVDCRVNSLLDRAYEAATATLDDFSTREAVLDAARNVVAAFGWLSPNACTALEVAPVTEVRKALKKWLSDSAELGQ